MTLWEPSSTSDNAIPKCTIWKEEKKKKKQLLVWLVLKKKKKRRRHRRVKIFTHLLESVCNGEQHTTAPRGRFSRDRDGKVIVERVGDERLCEAAHVGVRAEAVGGVPLKTRNKGDRRRKGDADQLRQVQGSLRTTVCKVTNMEMETTLEEGGPEHRVRYRPAGPQTKLD